VMTYATPGSKRLLLYFNTTNTTALLFPLLCTSLVINSSF
jgi:hypothetical protein